MFTYVSLSASFELLDSIKGDNIYRVYPHKLFCDKLIENRCIANDEKTIFYYDDDHLSIQGSKLVVDEIFFYHNVNTTTQLNIFF